MCVGEARLHLEEGLRKPGAVGGTAAAVSCGVAAIEALAEATMLQLASQRCDALARTPQLL